jgi:integrase
MGRPRKARKRGQIQARGADKFLVRVYLGTDSAGKRKYSGRTVDWSKKDAEKELTRMLREIDTSTFVAPSRDTLTAFIEQWIETKVDIAARTKADYLHLLQKHILPDLGGRKLDTIGSLEIQGVYASMVEQSLSPRTVRYTHTVLKQALDAAVQWDLLHKNPADYVNLPKNKRTKRTILSPEQADLFLEAASRDATLYPLWLVLLTAGLRPQEALALLWEDFSNPQIYVSKALAKDAHGGYTVGNPKRFKSARRITLPSTTAEALEAHRRSQAAEILSSGPEYVRSGLIFANSVGSHLDPSKLRKSFKRVLKRAGLPKMRLYDLRHTHASHLLLAGTNPKVVAERLGHADVSLTLNTYSHVLERVEEGAADTVEALLFRKKA